MHKPWDLETACPPQPSMESIYPPNQGTLSNLFTSFEFRPSRRTPERVDGSRTVAGTWGKRPGPGASTTSCSVWCVCMMNPHCFFTRPTWGTPDPTWSPPNGREQGCAISHIIRQADVLPCPPQGGWQHGHTHIHTHTHTHIHTQTHTHSHTLYGYPYSWRVISYILQYAYGWQLSWILSYPQKVTWILL